MTIQNITALLLVTFLSLSSAHGKSMEPEALRALILKAESDQVSAKKLGYMYIKGLNVKKDLSRGMFFLEKAAELGDDWSVKFLTDAYTNKRSPIYDLAKFQALRTRLLDAQQPTVHWAKSDALLKALNANKVLPIGTGSAFAINSNGYFVSNNHVTKSCNFIVAKYNGEYGVAELITADSKRDLSLLKVDSQTPHFVKIRTSNIAIGEKVSIGGFPFDPDSEMVTTDFVFSTGVVGTLPKVNGVSHIRVSAEVASGNSGGPAVDGRGALIGVAVAKRAAGRIGKDIVIGDNYNYLIANKELVDFLLSKNTEFNGHSSNNSLSSIQAAALLQRVSAQLICFAK
jgi:hypothetical protein